MSELRVLLRRGDGKSLTRRVVSVPRPSMRFMKIYKEVTL